MNGNCIIGLSDIAGFPVRAADIYKEKEAYFFILFRDLTRPFLFISCITVLARLHVVFAARDLMDVCLSLDVW